MVDDFEGWGNYDDEFEEIKWILEWLLIVKFLIYLVYWRLVFI